jgi:hypothetical protein
MNLNKSSSNLADVFKHMEDLYRIKSPKNSKFTFQHVCFMVKDAPQWNEGWMHEKVVKTPPYKRNESSLDYRESDCILVDATKESNCLDRIILHGALSWQR